MSRPLDRQERILARHLLQVLSENARSVRDALDPVHGMHTVTVAAWAKQWAALRAGLDAFTVSATAGRRPVFTGAGGIAADRNTGTVVQPETEQET